MGAGYRFSTLLFVGFGDDILEMKYSSGNKIEKNEMCGTCNVCGGEEMRI
jgi:hypothetical protein